VSFGGYVPLLFITFSTIFAIQNLPTTERKAMTTVTAAKTKPKAIPSRDVDILNRLFPTDRKPVCLTGF
jgi:hypothetical protein